MANEDIKKEIRAARLKFWQVAAVYGCNDSNFSRKLRFELPQEEKTRIYKIIMSLSGRRKE
ncbi:MAG: hypothetical protein PHU23_13430 [Dehalococcoidales bacterium]|nr:hypothetical protein [Dehalococcoidales bacterium]